MPTRITATRFTTTVRKPKPTSATVFILAAGINYRMKSFGSISLMNINDQFLLDYQINVVRTVVPNAEIIVVVGFEADKVMRVCRDDVHYVENQLYETTNYLEELRLAFNNCISINNVLIIHGDVVFNQQALDIISNESATIVDTRNQISDADIGVTVVNNKVCVFSYGLPTRWGHILYLTGKELDSFSRICKNRKQNKLFCWEALNSILKRGGKIKAVENKDQLISKLSRSRELFSLEEGRYH